VGKSTGRQRPRLPHIVDSKANSAAFLWRTELRLFCDLFQHEIRHDVGGLDGLGEGRVVPESVRKRIEEYEACIDTSPQIGAMQIFGSAKQGVSAAGDEESRRQAVQVRIDRGQHRIFRIGRPTWRQEALTIR
jgi:hypothetical protein